MKCSLGIFNFLEEISSFSLFVVFLYFFALITEEGFLYLSLLYFGTLHSDAYIFPFLHCFLLPFFSQLCPTLCDPIDGSPPVFPIPGILQEEHWSRLPFHRSYLYFKSFLCSKDRHWHVYNVVIMSWHRGSKFKIITELLESRGSMILLLMTWISSN